MGASKNSVGGGKSGKDNKPLALKPGSNPLTGKTAEEEETDILAILKLNPDDFKTEVEMYRERRRLERELEEDDDKPYEVPGK